MKKVLLGTTALVMTAGVAAADAPTLSGYAEIGINDPGAADVQFHHDLDVKFSMSGESDNGLSFGATIDLDEVGDDCAGGTITTSGGSTFAVCAGGDGISSRSGEHSVWVSGSFGTLTMGDTDGAFDWALTEVGALTSLADEHTSHAGYNGNGGLDGTNDGQVLRYDNSFGDFGVALSAELDDANGPVGDVMGIGVKWSMGDFGVGAGYQENDLEEVMGASLSANFGDVTGVLNYSNREGSTIGTDLDHFGLGLTYTTGALSVHANYGELDGTALGVAVDRDGFGLAVNYDLGGGAVAMLGYGSDNGSATGDAFWSAGLGLSF